MNARFWAAVLAMVGLIASARTAADGPAPGSLAIDGACIGVVHPLQWGDGTEEIPATPYCWTAAAWIPGDFDFDGQVTAADYDWFALCYSGPGVPYRCEINGVDCNCGLCDLDGDGDVDQDDFGLLQRQIGKGL